MKMVISFLCEIPDTYLTEIGWVRVHGEWILYDGYLRAKYFKDEKRRPLTEAQKKAILDYGNECHGGTLLFGSSRRQVKMSFSNRL